ncbi:MAG TPA: radical SAM protein [Bacteroidales bacterium]|nr:radical SAM protein [Bacteroidales bacterium]HQN16755.1 radical SAM protein [Bacteroidales bacterium]HQP16340.1 radical SAM protein [Bacteroidales bacterium]
MKVLLVNPPRSPENKILEFAPAEARHFIHKKLVGPPLGLLTIASSIKDFDVHLIDLKGEYDLHPDSPPLPILIRQYLEQIRPDIIGVTFIASEHPFGIEIFREAKKFNPQVLTVAGGLHTVLAPDDFARPEVDLVCPGQSADVFRAVVIAHSQNKTFDHIGGLIINKNNVLQSTKALRAPWNAAREDFIMPDRSLLKRWINTYIVGGRPVPATYIFTSLGCPYECSFCSIWPQFDKRFYQRRMDSIVEELKQIPEYKIVRFADANTIVDVDFISKLFDRIAAEGIEKEFVMDIRFDTTVKYPWLIEKLARAGLKVVICGFESFREEELKKYNKSSSASLIEEAITIFDQNNIMLRGNYVIPNDYNEDDFKALADYASSHRVVYAGYTILTPMPGTVFYRQVADQIIDHDLSKYNFFNSVLKTTLPLEKFYELTGSLWLIKKGSDVI